MIPGYHEQLSELQAIYGRSTVTISLTEAARCIRRDPRSLLRDSSFPVRKVGGGTKKARYSVPIVSLAMWLAKA